MDALMIADIAMLKKWRSALKEKQKNHGKSWNLTKKLQRKDIQSERDE